MAETNITTDFTQDSLAIDFTTESFAIDFGDVGISGISGYSGIGTSGYSGYSGSGISGYSGSGISGYSGSGISGYSGYSGTSGMSGDSTSGYSGYSGVTGADGADGADGVDGYSGFSGTSGAAVSTTGTSGYLAKFISPTEIANGPVYVDGSNNVGIGIDAPTAQLHLVKADSSALTDFLINPTLKTSGNFADFQIGSATKFKVDYTGKTYTPAVDISVAGSSGRNLYTPGYITIENAQNFIIRGLTTSYGADHTQLQIGDQAQTNTAGNRVVLNVVSNYNQASGTAANTDLLISRTQTAVGSGAQLLIDAQVGSVSKFSVTNLGAITAAAGITAPANSKLAVGSQNLTSGGVTTMVEIASGSNTKTSGTYSAVLIDPIYNQATGTAANTDLLISRTQTAVGSGAQLLIDAQVGSVSKFKVDNTGKVDIATGVAVTCVGGYLDQFGGWEPRDRDAYIGFGYGTARTFNFQNYGGAAGARTNTSSTTANTPFVSITPVYNQATGTAANTDLLINRTETAVGTGTQRLASFQVGSVEKFAFDNEGKQINTAALSDASGNETAFTLNYTTNKAAGDDTGLVINQTDTASPGTSYLFNAKVASSSVFNIRNDGFTSFKSLGINDYTSTTNTQASISQRFTTTSAGGIIASYVLSSAYADIGTTVTIPSVTGIVARGYANQLIGTINVTSVYGLRAYAGAGKTGGTTNVTNAYNIYAAENDGGDASTVTNEYKLYLTKPTRGTTLNYSIYVAGGENYFTDTNTSTSGTIANFKIAPIYNQATGTAANTDLLINRTQTAVGSGTQLLIDAQVGGVSKFKVTNTGAAVFTGRVDSGGFQALASYIQVDNGYGLVASDTNKSVVVGAVRNFTNAGTFVRMAEQTFSNITGSSVAISILPTYNQLSGDAANTDLLINRTQTAVGSGAQLLIDAQVGSATKFKVDNTGKTYTPAVDISVAGSSGRNVYTPGYITIENAQLFVIRGLTTSYGADHTQLQIGDQAQTNTAGNRVVLNVVSNYNQASGTAANTDLLISRTQTAVGSGAQLLIDAQVGGVSKFNVTNTGRVMLADGAAALPALSFISNPDTGIWYAPTNIFIGVDGTEVFRAYANKAIYLGGTSTGSLEIDPTNTTINATTAGATLQLNTKPSGTAGSTKVLFGSSTDSQTSGTNTIVSITPTYNQATGTAANTDLLISRTQTAVGSGAQLLIDAQVGGVSKFRVINTGTVAIGSTTNKTEMSVDATGEMTITSPTDKTVVISPVVWDDLRVPVTSLKDAGIKPPGFTQFKDNGAGSTGVFVYWFDKNTEEELFFTVQLPHSWAGTAITPHIHWVPKTAATGKTVEWGFEYTWANIDGTYGNSNIIYTKTTTSGDADYVAGKHYMSNFAAITPGAGTQDGISSMMVCRIFRNATDVTDDTYEDDAGMLEVDFHYAMNTVGSRTITTK